MIRAVFLDMFNTLCHFHPLREERQVHCLAEENIVANVDALRHAYLKGDEHWARENERWPINDRDAEALRQFHAEYEQVLLAAAGIEVSLEQAARIYQHYHHTEWGLLLYDDVLPTLEQLRSRGITLGLISNIDRDVTPYCNNLKLTPLLDFILSSCLVGAEKPDPRIFQTALELAGVLPEEALHVGDQYYADVTGARGVGIQPVLIDRLGAYLDLNDCIRVQRLDEITKYVL
ncbi:MAG: HAD family hydrolase [Chloroflexota bacterium]|nr:MAG: HAD family hydrolase [Chloroflexota bacterium]